MSHYPGLALLAATARSASPCRLPPWRGLSLRTSGVLECLRVTRACPLAWQCLGQRSRPQPPAPPIAGPAMDAPRAGEAARRAGETEQTGRQSPRRARSRALVEQGLGDVLAGTLAAVAPGACAPRSGVVTTPRSDVLALAPGPLQRTIVPPAWMALGVASVDVEEVVEIPEPWHP